MRFFSSFSDDTGNGKCDLVRLSRKLLNKAATNRVISKQECLVLLLDLDLVKCSDTFELIGIGDKMALKITGNSKQKKRYSTETYSKRPQCDWKLSLHSHFHKTKAQYIKDKRARWIIPHYTGANIMPVYPPTKHYVKSMLKIHQPWIGNFAFSDKNWEHQFDNLINSKSCSSFLSSGFTRAMSRFLDSRCYIECTAKEGILNTDVDEYMQEFFALTSRSMEIDEDEYCFAFEYGIQDFDWSQKLQIQRETEMPGSSWLMKEIEKSETLTKHDLELPMRNGPDGKSCHYELANLHKDQADIAAYVLHNIKLWMEHDHSRGPFETKFLTVRGKGGSGKTTLLKTLTSVVRRMFGTKNAVHVGGPTGASACNGGGCTYHRLFGFAPKNKSSRSVSEKTKDQLLPQFLETILLQLDERSMIGSKSLARMEIVARNVARGGFNTQLPWGGIPVVILYGDDYQIPSIEKGVFCIPLPGHSDIAPTISFDKMTIDGNELFLRAAENVMDLSVIKRQDANKIELMEQLDRVRHDCLTESDISDTFQKLHIQNFTPEASKRIQDKSLHVFANVAPKEEWNIRKLHDLHNKQNPVAKLRPKYVGRNKINKAIMSHFYDTTSPSVTKCCIGSWVSLAGRNLMPKWGLYNGARGRVIEFDFETNQNPNDGDLPGYTVVDFPFYKGPVWDRKHPTHVPIPVVRERCSKGCCTKDFIPLELSFATTIHKIQGLEAGPSKPGDSMKAAESMIIDIGNKQFEHKCPGLFYVAATRGSSFGDGDFSKSSIFFRGEDITFDRLLNLTKTKTGQTTVRAQRRRAWVDLLESNVHSSGLTPTEIQALFCWSAGIINDKSYSGSWIISRNQQDVLKSNIP